MRIAPAMWRVGTRIGWFCRAFGPTARSASGGRPPLADLEPSISPITDRGPLGAAGAAVACPAGRVRLQGGCRERIERAYGPGKGEDLAVHQALVKLVQVKLLRLLRVPGLQQVSGQGAQRDGAEPGRVQR